MRPADRPRRPRGPPPAPALPKGPALRSLLLAAAKKMKKRSMQACSQAGPRCDGRPRSRWRTTTLRTRPRPQTVQQQTVKRQKGKRERRQRGRHQRQPRERHLHGRGHAAPSPSPWPRSGVVVVVDLARPRRALSCLPFFVSVVSVVALGWVASCMVFVLRLSYTLTYYLHGVFVQLFESRRRGFECSPPELGQLNLSLHVNSGSGLEAERLRPQLMTSLKQ